MSHKDATPPDSDPTPEDEAAERDEHEDDDDRSLASKLPLPFAPDDDDGTPLGDTDQHSDA